MESYSFIDNHYGIIVSVNISSKLSSNEMLFYHNYYKTIKWKFIFLNKMRYSDKRETKRSWYFSYKSDLKMTDQSPSLTIFTLWLCVFFLDLS